MLVALGQADAHDEAGVMQALGALATHLDLSLSHRTHENHKIHAVVAARLPGGSAHQAEDLTHMHEEETELMPLIAANLSTAEIDGIEQSIVSNIPPAKMAGFLRVVWGAATRSERVTMVPEMRQAMPAEVFDGLFAAVMGEDWRFGDWDKMEQVLC